VAPATRPKPPLVSLVSTETGHLLGHLSDIWFLPRVGDLIALYAGDPERPERNLTPEFNDREQTPTYRVDSVTHKVYKSFPGNVIGGDFPHDDDDAYYDDIVMLGVTLVAREDLLPGGA
jgi:hypothetical protein